MDKDKLVELAERCEAATGRDPELEAEIAVHLDPPAFDQMRVPRYTASLDAAMTLLDATWRKRACDMDNSDCFFGIEPDDDTPEIGARAKTWPLAICAAALRSHAPK